MAQEDSITHSDFTNLLASGALLRDVRPSSEESSSKVLLMWGPFEAQAKDNSQAISVSCPPFYQVETGPWLVPARSAWVETSTVMRWCLRVIEEFSEPQVPVQWHEPQKADFEAAFVRVQNLIQEGQIDKAVPVVFSRAEGSVSIATKAKWVLSLLSLSPENLHVHGWWNETEGLLGATPEILFEIEGRELRTMALAGTLAKADGTGQDLLRSTKDQQEHRFVIDDIRNKLTRWGHVQIGQTGLRELPSLWHLHTEITVRLQEEPDIAELIQTMHPTAALGVSPRQFGWRWMKELPGQEDRSRFGAPFTVRMSSDRVRSLVSIRQIQWNRHHLMLGSGCGVVAQSQIEPEWLELQRKRQSVLKLLGMMP